MANEQTTVLNIEVNYADGIKAIAEYKTQIDALKKTEQEYKKQLKEYSEQLKKKEINQEEYNNKLQEYNEKMADSKLKTAELNDAARTMEKQLSNQLKIQKENEGSLKQLRAELSNATAAYDAMSKAEREGADGLELKDKINEITTALKGAEEETQRYYRNVGNYTNSIIEAANANIPFVNEINNSVTALKGLGGYLKDVGDELKNIGVQFKTAQVETVGMTTAQKSLTTALNLTSAAFKVLKVAIISTGIGALVIALGSLVSYFTKTQAGIETASKAMAGLGAIVNVIIDRLSKVGSAIVNLFKGNFKQSANDMKGAFKGIGDEIEREVKLAVQLKEALNQIEKQEITLSMRRSANKAQIEELKKISDDTTKSTNERITAAQKAYELEKKDLDLQVQLQERRLANTLGYTRMNDEVRKLLDTIKSGDITADELIGKLGISESNIEDLKEFRDQFNALQELQESSFTRQTEQQNTLNSLRQEAATKISEQQKAEAEALVAAKQKEVEEVRKAEDELLKLITDGRERQRQEVEVAYERQIEDLKTRLQTEKDLTTEAQQAINTQIIALEQQKQMELQTLSQEALQDEIQRKQEEFQTLLEQEKEQIQVRFETLLEQNVDNEQAKLEIELQQKQAELDAMQQLEGESQEAFNLRKLKAQNAYNAQKKKLNDYEVQMEQAKLGAISQITGSLAGLFDVMGEKNKAFAVLSKTLALAEIAINTGKAIAAGVAQSQSVPFPANLVAVATTIATVLTNITTAINTVKSAKFASGGLVTGPGTGTSDSIPAMLSNGESVMTARTTSMFAPILSSFNQMGGGVPISVAESSNQTLGEDMLARSIQKGMSGIQPVVSVEEITKVSNRVKIIERVGTL